MRTKGNRKKSGQLGSHAQKRRAKFAVLVEKHSSSSPKEMRKFVNVFDNKFRGLHRTHLKLKDSQYGILDRIYRSGGKRFRISSPASVVITAHRRATDMSARWEAVLIEKMSMYNNEKETLEKLQQEMRALARAKKGTSHAGQLVALLEKKIDKAVKTKDRAIGDICRWVPDFNPEIFNGVGEIDFDEVDYPLDLPSCVAVAW